MVQLLVRRHLGHIASSLIESSRIRVISIWDGEGHTVIYFVADTTGYTGGITTPTLNKIEGPTIWNLHYELLLPDHHL